MTAARRLAAILAADVVGYSRLMGVDEAGTAKIVRERREAVTPIVRAFGGRVVKTTGDGVTRPMGRKQSRQSQYKLAPPTGTD
jgi:class 3 adenylate cyclase